MSVVNTFGRWKDPSKNRSGIPAEFQRDSRSSLDSGQSLPEFQVTATWNSGFRWIPGSGPGVWRIPGLEFWSPVEFWVWNLPSDGTPVQSLESSRIPGLELWSQAENLEAGGIPDSSLAASQSGYSL